MKTQKLRISLRIVFYQDHGLWIAHCLEFDLLGDGETKEEAARQLMDAIATQVHCFLENRDATSLFSPAPPEIQRMFAAGDEVDCTNQTIEPSREQNDAIFLRAHDSRGRCRHGSAGVKAQLPSIGRQKRQRAFNRFGFFVPKRRI